MRRNMNNRRKNLALHYDIEYVYLPDQPCVGRIIDHTRKLIQINRDADPRRAEVVELFAPGTQTERMEKDNMKNKRHVKPVGFEHFMICEVEAPGESWVRHYDIVNEIIWINTAAADGSNVVKAEPEKG